MTASHPWLKNYPPGIPANINPDKFPNLNELIIDALQRYGNKTAFSCMDKKLTFHQVNKYAGYFAAYLLSKGLQPGDRIAIMMPNLLQYPIALFGAIRAGLVVVNTNPLYTPREMQYQFADSGAKAIVIVENFASNLEKIMGETSIELVIKTSIGEMLGFPKAQIVDFVIKHLKKMVPAYHLPNAISFSTALKEGRRLPKPDFHPLPDDTVLLQYTGGTTGVSKGAMLTHRNMVANVLQNKAIMQPFLEEGKEVALCALPLYHIFAFTVNCLSMLQIGAHSVLVTNPRDIKGLIKTIKNNPPSLITGINTLFNALLQQDDFVTSDFSTLKATVGGGMAVQNPVAISWEKITGCYLAQGYGLTETSPTLSVNPIDGHGKLGSIGLPLPSTCMRIVDDNGKVLEPGEIGEIQASGPQIMKGYYNQPEETDAVLKDGWFSTGDLGYMEPDGFFSIVDRKKDMILVSGFNVYPNEIEEVLVAHPDVLEAAVVGMQDGKSGEAVKAFVVLINKGTGKKELLAHCRENLTAYKIPKEIVFKEELPKTNVGKILRRELKSE
jgi:long-chain acyl-CoA synthetase